MGGSVSDFTRPSSRLSCGARHLVHRRCLPLGRRWGRGPAVLGVGWCRGDPSFRGVRGGGILEVGSPWWRGVYAAVVLLWLRWVAVVMLSKAGMEGVIRMSGRARGIRVRLADLATGTHTDAFGPERDGASRPRLLSG